MKKYITVAVGVVLVHFFLYTYLFSVGTLHMSEGNSLSWLMPSLALSLIALPINTLFPMAATWFAMWLFKNKMEKNWGYLMLIVFVTGSFTLFLQILIGQQLFSNLVSSINPFAFLVLGGLAMLVSSLLFVKLTPPKQKVEAVVFGVDKGAKEFAEGFNSSVLVSSVEELRKSLDTYSAEIYVLIDLSEFEVTKVIKILELESVEVAYLYTLEEPKFSQKNVESWKESHSFSVAKLSVARLGMILRKIRLSI